MPSNATKTKSIPVASYVTDRGLMVEMLYVQREERTRLAIGRDGTWQVQDRVMLPNGLTLVPMSAGNNLIQSRCILLPERPEPFGSTEALLDAIRAYLDKYVTLSIEFRTLASWYVLFSWVHDAFKELPYLRFRGDYGTGKTRALIVLGSICYRPFFASGATTTSPIFHTLESFGGTLMLDEADFRLSDEKADIVKILNNGNISGMPVLRTIVSKDREFNPRAFRVFGPKIVAMRKDYDDPALESRFLTEQTDHVIPSANIPISMPASQEIDALELRNRLLAYRFANRNRVSTQPNVDWRGEERLRQTVLPLLSIIDDLNERELVRQAAVVAYNLGIHIRSRSWEAEMLQTLVALKALSSEAIAVGDIAAQFNEAFSDQMGWSVSARWVGNFLRDRFRLTTRKSNGVYVIPIEEWHKVDALTRRIVLPNRPL